LKADAVVLFIGPDLDVRVKEANRLLSEGYAKYLIVPAFNQVINTAHKRLPVINAEYSETKQTSIFSKYPRFYEDTHIEVLETKRIMDHFGFKKANFVSSPSHMRRIKLITDSVFLLRLKDGDTYHINYVPAYVGDKQHDTPSWDLESIKDVLEESIKIIWFFWTRHHISMTDWVLMSALTQNLRKV